MRYRDKEWLEEVYEDHSMHEMAEMEDVSHSTILRWMDRHDIERRDQSAAHFPDGKYTDEEWLSEQYTERRRSTREIADECGVSRETVRRWLYNHDIEIRRGSEAVKAQWEGADERRRKTAERFEEHRQQWHEMDEETQKRTREKFSEWWSENNPMEGRTGEENPAWKGGHSKWYGSNWEEQRAKALDRDGHECQRCGATDDLVVHHHTPIRIWKNAPEKDREDANQLWNLVTLCTECHGSIERRRAMR